VYDECDEYNVCDSTRMPGSHSVSTDAPDTPLITFPPLTVVGIRELGQVKLEKLQKARLVEAVIACMAHIDLLESDKAPAGDSKLRSELRELNKAVFVSVSGANAHVPADTQEYLDRLDIGWDAIHKLAAEQNGTPVAPNVTSVTSIGDADATPEDDTTKSAKLAKRVKLAKSTALWCLSPFTPVTQEAMDKPRKVCLVNLRG
jgi:hypothetical protein